MNRKEEIAKKVEELAKQIEKDYEGEQLLVVGILKGASVFVSDLIRKINLDVNIDFMSVSSYGNGTESSGTVRILKDLDVDIAGKNVLIVEDIVTTGGSVKEVVDVVREHRGIPVGVGMLVDRSGGKAVFDIPVQALLHLDVPTYDPEACPLCAQSIPITKRGSKNL